MRDFEGVCYDGPNEGEIIRQPSPWFRAPIYPSSLPRYLDQNCMDDMPIELRVAEYTWSRPLRKWVWVQR